MSRAYGAALRLLSHRPRTEQELEERLRRRFAATLVDQVVELLRAEGLVSDVRFARDWTAGRESRNPKSAWVIKRELVAKGIDDAVADDAVSDLDDEENAYRVGLKAAGTMQGVDLPAFRRRLWGYLRRRGFGDSVCRRTIERIWDEAAARNRSDADGTA
jgi:regulatory protein